MNDNLETTPHEELVDLAWLLQYTHDNNRPEVHELALKRVKELIEEIE